MAREARVAVLGGGLAGLAAAVELRRRRPELELTVLEARQRLGGRAWTELDDAGWPLERGAEFVHGQPAAFLAELRRARIEPCKDEGAFWIAGSRRPAGDPFEGWSRVLETARRLPDRSVDALFDRPGLRETGARDFARAFTAGFYVAPPGRASARAIARMEAAADAIGGDAGAQLPRGYGELARALAARLDPSHVRRGVAVRRIEWRKGRVRLAARGLSGVPLSLEVDRAIVALPLPALQRGGVAFRPSLRENGRAAGALRMGDCVKLQLRFQGELHEGPFLCLAPGQPVPTWWRGAPAGSPWVVGWAGGPNADRLERLGDAALLRAALASLAKAFSARPSTLERRLTGFQATRWRRDPFAGGAYAWVPVGAAGAMEALARPVAGTLFFAGEATHPDHAGTTHGAWESGRRAAHEVLATL